MNIMLIILVFIQSLFESATFMWLLCIIFLALIGKIYDNRKCDTLKNWQRNALYILLSLCVLGTAAIARHNDHVNHIIECKQICHNL